MAVYGDTLNAKELEDFLAFLLETNLAREEKTKERPTPICIWGRHGLGKTASVISFAKKNEWKLAYCAPAQFEEMGDFHGLPIKVQDGKTSHTTYLPPDWVPKEEGPGILLLDDINRADDRILRGLMQLLQNFEMFSWKLPTKWQIVCTANPEDDEYSVTPMDEAMLTRLLHTNMVFDVKAWAAWATANEVDSRGINFVLTYPESVTGKRTTPRSLVQVFSQIQEIPDLKREIKKVSTIARSGLDETTVSSFLAFINSDLEFLVEAKDILESVSFDKEIKPKIAAAAKGKGSAVRLDRLSVICTRLVIAISNDEYAMPSERNKSNVVAFLSMPELPADLRFSVHKDIVDMSDDRSKLVQDPALAKLVLASV
jgi:MoxR-like ATPase